MKDNEFNSLDQANEFIKKVISPILPSAKTSYKAATSAFDKPATAFEVKLSPRTLFDDSVYEYKGDGKFIHFTSLLGLKSILESGFLRMSEFGSLSDKNELHFGTSIFKEDAKFQMEAKKIDKLKQDLFCLSVCKSDEETKLNSFMWEAYGDRCKGAIIEFEIHNKKPSAFLLGEVQYGNEGLKPLEKIKELADAYYTEHFIENKNGIFPSDFLTLIHGIASFHKAKKYKDEKEVRLFFDAKGLFLNSNKRTTPTVYKDINSYSEVKNYIKLFLKGRHELLHLKFPYSDDKDEIFNVFPQIEIKTVILGNEITTKNKLDLFRFLIALKEKHGYGFDLKHVNSENEIIEMTKSNKHPKINTVSQ